MMTWTNPLWLLLGAVLFIVTACGGGASSVALPLADDQPTFIYFYTDG